jgi:hypothetical protein
MRKRALLVLLAVTGATLTSPLSAAADPPSVRQFQDVFVDVNPCTGLDHTVTIDITFYSVVPNHTHRATHAVTTSSGFVGRGEEVGVFDSNIFLLNDLLVNAETGQRIHAQWIGVANPATGDLQVFRQTLTCIPAGQT